MNTKSISIDRTAAAYISMVGEQKLPELLKYLEREGVTLATAESCTGGLIGKLITDIPGSSAVYSGGVICYTNEVKINIVGVSAATISEHTEVSAETACEMAQGIRARIGASFGIATTGFAGPSGGTPENPMGTVYIAVSSERVTEVIRVSFDGESSRGEIRCAGAYFALEMLERMAKRLTNG